MGRLPFKRTLDRAVPDTTVGSGTARSSGPRHHRFLILLFAVSAKLILLLLVFMILQVSDIYIRSILLFSIVDFCSL